MHTEGCPVAKRELGKLPCQGLHPLVRVIEELCLVVGDPIGMGGNAVAFGAVVLDEGGPVLFQERAREGVAQVAVGLVGIRAGNLLTAARKWPETGGQKIPDGNQTTRVCVVAPA
jgi:hypothetical protein